MEDANAITSAMLKKRSTATFDHVLSMDSTPTGVHSHVAQNHAVEVNRPVSVSAPTHDPSSVANDASVLSSKLRTATLILVPFMVNGPPTARGTNALFLAVEE